MLPQNGTGIRHKSRTEMFSGADDYSKWTDFSFLLELKAGAESANLFVGCPEVYDNMLCVL